MPNKFEGPFRQSVINDYMICQRRFYYAHILGLEREFRSPYLIYGTAMHEAIAMLHKKEFSLENADDYLRHLIELAEAKEASPVAWKNREAEIADWLPDNISILHHYWEKDYNRECQVILSEAQFEVKIGPFPFTGTIDQLRRQGSEVHLWDFKTGTAAIPQVYVDLDYQTSIYAYACAYGTFKLPSGDFKFGTIPDRVGIYKLNDHLPYKNNSGKNGKKGEERGPARYGSTRTQADFDATIRDLGFICRSIVGPHYGAKGLVKGGSFARNPINVGGLQTCGQCPFQGECTADRKSAEIITEEITLTDEDVYVS
jgi:hypothetical protein